MYKLKEQLNKELEYNLFFWLNHVVDKNTNHIFPEISIDGKPNIEADFGVMYLSRILYGASTAYELNKNESYLELADLAYAQLKEFSNPIGGYNWAKTSSNVFIHDAENTNMAQAFVLYGLVAYAQIFPCETLDENIQTQFDFINNTLYDSDNGGFIDGFDENWILGNSPTKALGTHLHLLEAFVKLYEYKGSEKVVKQIEELITIITRKFITKDTYDCLHRLTPDWKPLPNEIWAGHNAECSWILCNAAKAIGSKDFLKQCQELSLKMMKEVCDKAFDKNGGVCNVLDNNVPTEDVKIWWVQAETVLGLLNCYKITNENTYKDQAIELIDFISTNFISEKGEWYTEIYHNGQANQSIPIIHFWKSMYHTIRYYSEVNKNL